MAYWGRTGFLGQREKPNKSISHNTTLFTKYNDLGYENIGNSELKSKPEVYAINDTIISVCKECYYSF